MFEVASSKIIISLSPSIALARANLCFCPPDKALPPSPTFVSNPLLKEATNSSNLAFTNASLISDLVASLFPIKRLSKIVPLNM